jgi:hypothetical protein
MEPALWHYIYHRQAQAHSHGHGHDHGHGHSNGHGHVHIHIQGQTVYRRESIVAVSRLPQTQK